MASWLQCNYPNSPMGMRLFPAYLPIHIPIQIPQIFPFTYGKFPQLHCNSRRYHFVIKAHSHIPFYNEML